MTRISVVLLLSITTVCLAQNQRINTPDDPVRSYLFTYVQAPDEIEYLFRIGFPWLTGGSLDEVVARAETTYSDRTELARALVPDILYVSCASPCSYWPGSSEGRFASPEMIREQMARTTAHIAQYHDWGVPVVTPYICAITAAGDPDQRLGIWEFYDRWDEFTDLDLGPKPPDDPIQWLQRKPDGSPRFIYPNDFPQYRPLRRWSMCMNNPYWRQYLGALMRTFAHMGYDGTFIDNPMQRCACKWCRPAFRRYMADRFSPEQLREQFGIEDVEKLEPPEDDQIGSPLFAEWWRFRGGITGDFFAFLKTQGESVAGEGNFLIIPNGALNFRARDGWSIVGFNDGGRGFDVGFNEERNQRIGVQRSPAWPGMERHSYHDFALKYKFTAGLVGPAKAAPEFDSNAFKDLDHYRLGFGEAVAFDGCLLDVQRLVGAERASVYEFVRKHRDLFAERPGYGQVALIALSEEYYCNVETHMREVAEAIELLLDEHVLFDIIPDDSVSAEQLARYPVALLPGAGRISDQQADALRTYVQEGGALLATGAAGTMYAWGTARNTPALDDLVPATTSLDAPPAQCGEGKALLLPVWLAAGNASQHQQDAELTTRAPALVMRGLRGLGPAPLSAVTADVGPGLRLNAFVERSAARARVILHLLNYDISFAEGAEADVQVHPKTGVPVALRLPEGMHATAVTIHRPDADSVAVEATGHPEGVSFTVPEVRSWAVAEVELAPGAVEGSSLAETAGQPGPRRTFVSHAAVPLEAGDRLVPVTQQAPAGPPAAEAIFAYPQYILVYAGAGEQVRAMISVIRNWYPTPTVYEVIAPDGATIGQGAIAPLQERQVSFTAAGAGVYGIRVDPGSNVCTVVPDSAHWGWWASPDTPLKIRRIVAPLYFLVPAGATVIPLSLQGGDRDPVVIVVRGPDGAEVAMSEPIARGEKLAWDVAVPAGADGRAWSFEVRIADPALAAAHSQYIESWIAFRGDWPCTVAESPERLIAPAKFVGR
ncbi:MAG TPA: hypothetical protein VM283_03710 [Armatimonadota bacterium]|nr:hypothetical protein [Armatimonadota bacterium]